MITDTPCRRYLLHLMLGGKTVQQVEDHALEMGLDYGSIQLLVLIRERGAPPEVFRPRDLNHRPSQEFLESVGLLGNFPRLSREGGAAFQLHQNPRAREILELGLLGRMPIHEILSLLAESKVRTRVEVLEAYAHLFWDVAGMDSTELRALLHLRTPDVARLQKLSALQDSREAEAGMPVAVTPQRGGGGGGRPDANSLPLPYETLTPERPTPSELRQSRQWRAHGKRDFVRQLARSMPLHERARQADALKRAHYSDPRLTISSLPASPLTVALTRSYLGMQMDRLDLKKAYEVLHHLVFHRTVEQAVSNHPEAPLRLGSLLSSAATLVRIQKELGAGTASLQNQIQVMALQTNLEGHYGSPNELTGGHHNLDPYSDADSANLKEITGKGAGRTANQVTTVDADEEEEDEETVGLWRGGGSCVRIAECSTSKTSTTSGRSLGTSPPPPRRPRTPTACTSTSSTQTS